MIEIIFYIKNIHEAVIIITSRCKQTLYVIWTDLISTSLNVESNSPQILWFFDGVYFFLWPAFFSIYLLQADNWEESLIIFSDVLKTTLAICHIVGNPTTD